MSIRGAEIRPREDRYDQNPRRLGAYGTIIQDGATTDDEWNRQKKARQSPSRGSINLGILNITTHLRTYSAVEGSHRESRKVRDPIIGSFLVKPGPLQQQQSPRGGIPVSILVLYLTAHLPTMHCTEQCYTLSLYFVFPSLYVLLLCSSLLDPPRLALKPIWPNPNPSPSPTSKPASKQALA